MYAWTMKDRTRRQPDQLDNDGRFVPAASSTTWLVHLPQAFSRAISRKVVQQISTDTKRRALPLRRRSLLYSRRP